MGIFGKSDQNGIVSKETTLISKSAKIVGDIVLEANLHIDGEVEGVITSSTLVSIGKSGRFKGEIKAEKVMVSGLVNGKIDANNLEILSGGRVIGEVFVKHITIENMGIFNGVCHHKEDELEEPKQIQLKE